MAREPLPYVDLLEAIRVVVRLLADGGQLADVMTDDWIKGGCWRWNGKFDDDPTMVDLYGHDWREVRPKVLSAYGEASRILETILPLGKVGGVGVSCAREAEGPRKIELFEWSSLQLELLRSLLATPAGKRLEDFPAIRSVRVCTEDLQRESSKVIKAGQDEVKSSIDLRALLLAEKARMNRIPTQNEAEKIAREAGATDPRKKIRETLRSIGGSTKPGPKGPRRNRAAQAA